MAYHPTYKSQVYVPIKKDNRSFEERQRSIWDEIHNDLDRDFISRDVSMPTRSAHPGGGGAGQVRLVDTPMGGGSSGGIWDDMHARMERRRHEWEEEVERMRKDFFKLTPTGSGSSGGVGGPTNGGEHITQTTNGGGSLMAGKPQEVYLEDGQGDRKFRVSFDVSQFSPNEINVRTQENKLIVHAKHEETGEGKNVSREFSRQIDLPKHVDPERLQSTLSKDGILQVEAPVAAPSYDRITADTAAPVRSMAHLPPLQTSGLSGSGSGSPGSSFKTGPVLTEQDGSRRLKMTVEIGKEFKPDEVMVKTVDKKLQISAKHEEQVQGRTTMREFSKELELPDNVDPNSVTASMSEDGKLIIEAPMSGYTQGSYQGKPGSTKQPEVTVSFK